MWTTRQLPGFNQRSGCFIAKTRLYLIVSIDTIMKPPYTISPLMLRLVASIFEKLGIIKAGFFEKPAPQLRKQNKIKTIHASLKIEGNTLTVDQVTAIIEDKRVLGPAKDILEVINAKNVYDNLQMFDPVSSQSFLSAHRMMMEGLIDKPGRYRTEQVGIAQGSKVTHLAPPPGNVHYLMEDLFSYLKHEEELTLIKSCVFHYELEFIHPFVDGNGRMGRLWQSVILTKENPVFENLPFETLINQTQREYYEALSQSDKMGKSDVFIEYMLRVIDESLVELMQNKTKPLSPEGRLDYFISTDVAFFTGKDYQRVFKNISAATASRDLKQGIEMGLLEKSGEKNQTIYRVKH